MKNYLLVFTFALLFGSATQASAQSEVAAEISASAINQTDAYSKRQGLWQYVDNNLNVVMEGNFKDDRPVGVIKYFKGKQLVLEYEYPEQRERFLWTYHGKKNPIKGYSVPDKNKITHYFENGKKLNPDQIHEVFSNYDTEVAFEGGYLGLRSYLIENLKYPEKARKKGIEGEVYLSFIVNKHGGVREIKVVKGVEETLDEEAVRLVQEMPKWTPSTQRGYTAETRHTLIIPFKIPEAIANIRER